jgi:U3 small nucleolar RNA-associated protein 3
VNRLLQLKEGVSMLEDLDFAAGQDSDEDPLLMGEDSDDEELDEDDDDDDDDGEDDEADKGLSLKELKAEKKKLLAQLRIEAANGDDSDQEEEEDDDLDLMRGDVDDSWKDEDLEDGELEDLLRELQEEEEEAEEAETIPVAQASTKGKKLSKKAKKRAQQEKTMPPSTSSTLPAPLAEPAFYTSKKSKSDARRRDAEDDTLGDPTALLEADAADKERRTKSLRFHTSKIAATSARRSAARNQRLTGDEDVPYRDRQAARDAALRRNGPAAVGEPLGSDEVEMKEKKRARQEEDEMDDGDDGEGDAADGYYELVKRRKTEKKDARQAAHDEQQAEKL